MVALIGTSVPAGIALASPSSVTVETTATTIAPTAQNRAMARGKVATQLFQQEIAEAQQAIAEKKAAEEAAEKAAQVAAKKKAEEAKKTTGEKAVDKAKNYIGTPYRSGGSTPSGFDCSGFTMYVYKKLGIKLTHNSQAQYNECKKVSKGSMKPGDLVFFGSSTSSIHHVGIYVGNGKYIHSPQTGESVRIDNLSRRHNFVGAARPY